MEYKVRPGVVLTEICGEYLIIAAKEARKYCPYVNQVNESFAFLWGLLEDWSRKESLEEALLEVYDLPDSISVETEINSFLNQMDNAGYLVKRKEDLNHE